MDPENFLYVTTSARSQSLCKFVTSFQQRRGYAPTVREIGAHMGLSSSSTVHALLVDMRQAGMVNWVPGIPRTLKVVNIHGDKRAARRASR